MNVKSADIRSISQCTEVYLLILTADEKRTHLTSRVLLTQFYTGLRIIKTLP